MRNTSKRQMLAALFAALYTAHFVGSGALHLWLCHTGSGEPCEVTQHDHSHSHSHAHQSCGHESSRAPDEGEVPVPGRDEHQHNPSDCLTCQILAQSGEKPDINLAIESEESVADLSQIVEEVYLSPSRSGFHSRAPPKA